MADILVELDQKDQTTFDLGQQDHSSFDLGNTQVVYSGLKWSEDPVDTGIVKYDSETETYSTITPDSELNPESDDIATSKAIANYVKNNIDFPIALRIKPIAYTVIIDKANPDPYERCTYAGGATGLEPMFNDNGVINTNGWEDRFPFNQIKPCVIEAGVFKGYLNPNDFTKYEDGTDVGSENADSFVDVMIEIPKIYYYIETVDEKIYVNISAEKENDKYVCWAHVYDGIECDKIYVAAYDCVPKTYNGSGTFFSASGISPDNSSRTIYYNNYYNYMLNKEKGYRYLMHDQVTLMQCLFLLANKTTNSSSYALGATSSSVYTNGYADKMGMYVGSTTEYTPVKFMGIENFYGNVWQKVEGLRVDSQPYSKIYKIARRDPYSTLELTRDGENYEPLITNPSLNALISIKQYHTNPYGNTEFGFVPQSETYNDKTGSSSTYFCDSVDIAEYRGYFWGGEHDWGDYAGVFCIRADMGLNQVYYNNGYRIVYYDIGGNS